MPGGILILDGLTMPQALRAIERRMDAMLVFELQLLACELASEGAGRETIEAMLVDRREQFATWRGERLAELRRWLVGCDRRRMH